MPVRREVAITAAAVAAAGVLVGGVAAVSNASTTNQPASTAYAAAESGYGTAASQQGQEPREGRGGHAHTAVTGAELAKVTAAVKAKDSAVTVVQVRKDPDGSYDVRGTKSGAPVRLEVSKDLATITAKAAHRQEAREGMERPEPTSPSGAATSATSTT